MKIITNPTTSNFYHNFPYKYICGHINKSFDIIKHWLYDKNKKIILYYFDRIEFNQECLKITDEEERLKKYKEIKKFYIIEGFLIDYGFDINNDEEYILLKSNIFGKKYKITRTKYINYDEGKNKTMSIYYNYYHNYKIGLSEYRYDLNYDPYLGYKKYNYITGSTYKDKNFDDLNKHYCEFKENMIKNLVNEMFKQKCAMILAQYYFRNNSYFNLLPIEIIRKILQYYISDNYYQIYETFCEIDFINQDLDHITFLYYFNFKKNINLQC